MCQFLAWDSAFFGVRIGRVTSGRLTEADVAAIDAWCSEQAIDCLYFLADSDDDATVRLAERNGFHQVDIRLTLATTLKQPPSSAPSIAIRAFEVGDIDALKRIAAGSYTDSRFYYDGHFARERCDALYALWVEKACADPKQRVLVADVNNQVAGFVACERLDNGEGQIGLLGVDAGFRGQGIGPQVIQAALAWLYGQGVRQVNVVTQGRNIAAQRSYQRSGFMTQQVQLWYHRWFNR